MVACAFEIPKNLNDQWKKIGDKASKKAEKHEKMYQKKIRKLGWLGWSLSNKFKKDFPPGYNVIKNSILSLLKS